MESNQTPSIEVRLHNRRLTAAGEEHGSRCGGGAEGEHRGALEARVVPEQRVVEPDPARRADLVRRRPRNTRTQAAPCNQQRSDVRKRAANCG